MESIDPANEYRKRLNVWQGQERKARRESMRFGSYRLGVAAAAGLIGWLSFVAHVAPAWLLALPAAVFIGLVVEHERVAQREEFARRGVRYYERAIRRVGGDWAGTGASGGRFADPSHVFSGDLDVFGVGSLFELLSTARTAAGEQRLADWLLHPATPASVGERQRAVAEMRDAVQLREDLALLGEDIRAGVHAEAIAAWGAAPPIPYFAGARAAAAGLAVLTIVVFVGFMAHWFGARPLVAAVAAALCVGFAVRKSTAAVAAGADTPAHDLRILSLLLGRLEHVHFESPLLERLRAEFDTHGQPASRRIRRLERWMELLDSADHLAVRVIGPPLLWRHQAAMGIEAWRRVSGPDIGRWIAAIAELEAISSLASFAYEHPAAAFPEIVADGNCFEARGLRHPLIGEAKSVANDVAIGGARRLLIVSGSNMSGKSTLLRSVGLNTVLAWAGAPVTAASLRVSPLAVGASIRIVDSLQDGKSRFYAEITRLRQIVEAAGAGPTLFLLDELLSGTNSHDRKIGAEAVIRTLVERGAVGLVTTHDLALTRIQQEFGEAAVNVHFEDQLEDGRIRFDYRLKPGVVERSNALELMRIVGLPVR